MTHIYSIKFINVEGEKVDVMCQKTENFNSHSAGSYLKKQTSWNAHDWETISR